MVPSRFSTPEENLLTVAYDINVTDQNFVHEEIKRRLNSSNACYHSLQNLLFFRLQSINVKIIIYKTIILPVVLYGCDTWPWTLREEHGLGMFENRC
jgi:hypothetical protein